MGLFDKKENGMFKCTRSIFNLQQQCSCKMSLIQFWSHSKAFHHSNNLIGSPHLILCMVLNDSTWSCGDLVGAVVCTVSFFFCRSKLQHIRKSCQCRFHCKKTPFYSRAELSGPLFSNTQQKTSISGCDSEWVDPTLPTLNSNSTTSNSTTWD